MPKQSIKIKQNNLTVNTALTTNSNSKKRLNSQRKGKGGSPRVQSKRIALDSKNEVNGITVSHSAGKMMPKSQKNKHSSSQMMEGFTSTTPNPSFSLKNQKGKRISTVLPSPPQSPIHSPIIENQKNDKKTMVNEMNEIKKVKKVVFNEIVEVGYTHSSEDYDRTSQHLTKLNQKDILEILILRNQYQTETQRLEKERECCQQQQQQQSQFQTQSSLISSIGVLATASIYQQQQQNQLEKYFYQAMHYQQQQFMQQQQQQLNSSTSSSNNVWQGLDSWVRNQELMSTTAATSTTTTPIATTLDTTSSMNTEAIITSSPLPSQVNSINPANAYSYYGSGVVTSRVDHGSMYNQVQHNLGNMIQAEHSLSHNIWYSRDNNLSFRNIYGESKNESSSSLDQSNYYSDSSLASNKMMNPMNSFHNPYSGYDDNNRYNHNLNSSYTQFQTLPSRPYYNSNDFYYHHNLKFSHDIQLYSIMNTPMEVM